MTWIKDIVNRFFRVEEINGANRCPTYLYRWHLLRLPWLAIYLHHFVGDDWSRDMHDHPKRFISVGLAGGYFEKTPNGLRRFKAPWIRTFRANHVHRLKLGGFADCWTLVVVFKTVREWGFLSGGRWIHWKQYVRGEMADKAKNC